LFLPSPLVNSHNQDSDNLSSSLYYAQATTNTVTATQVLTDAEAYAPDIAVDGNILPPSLYMHPTGQVFNSYMELYLMGDRWYDPLLGRFVSPDTVVPEVENPASLSWLVDPSSRPTYNTKQEDYYLNER
jgi:hypothetical protein